MATNANKTDASKLIGLYNELVPCLDLTSSSIDDSISVQPCVMCLTEEKRIAQNTVPIEKDLLRLNLIESRQGNIASNSVCAPLCMECFHVYMEMYSTLTVKHALDTITIPKKHNDSVDAPSCAGAKRKSLAPTHDSLESQESHTKHDSQESRALHDSQESRALHAKRQKCQLIESVDVEPQQQSESKTFEKTKRKTFRDLCALNTVQDTANAVSIHDDDQELRLAQRLFWSAAANTDLMTILDDAVKAARINKKKTRTKASKASNVIQRLLMFGEALKKVQLWSESELASSA